MIRSYGARRRRANPILLLAAFLALPAAPARVVAARPIRLLAFGDSLTAGYGLPHDQGFEAQLQAALRKAGYNVTVLDGAVSGDTSADGRARLDWVLADKPDAAIVELGANDGLRGVDPRVMQDNLTAILDRFAAARIPVLLTGMYAPPNLGRGYGDAFRAVFAHLSQRPGLTYDPFFLDGVAADPALNQPDGMHPNAQGVARIVTRLLPAVERLIAEVPAT